MITIKDFTEAVKYKITGGAEYQWQCFGPNARYLDADSLDDYSASIVFDSETQEVYIAEVWDYKKYRQYKLINPAYKEKYIAESNERGVEYDMALENAKFTILETDEDWIEKATAIVAGEEYDNRIEVPITLPDAEMFRLMKLAHENDITLNQMVERILQMAIDKEKSNG